MANRHKVAKKRGGSVQGHEEHASEIRKEAKFKTGGKVPGYKSGGRLDKRARGGGVGSDRNPFSSAKVGK